MTDQSVSPSTETTLPTRRTYRWPWPEMLSDWGIQGFFPEHFAANPDVVKMRVEEFEDEGMLVIRGEIPGVDPDKDIEITVDNGQLRIRAERRETSEAEEKGTFQSEFSYGSYSRTMTLPPGVTEDDVKASYTDGILEVRMPLNPEVAEARKVPISRT